MLKKEELDSIKAMDTLCELKSQLLPHFEFKHITINGVLLEYSDFGEKYDIAPEEAESYSCGNMKFIPFDIIPDGVLKKYSITEEEAYQIQEKLDCLSFGRCGWCV